MRGHPWMIVAENALVDRQRSLIGLLGKNPLLLAFVVLRHIVQ